MKTVIAGHGQLVKPLQMILSLAIYDNFFDFKQVSHLHRVDTGVQHYGIPLCIIQ